MRLTIYSSPLVLLLAVTASADPLLLGQEKFACLPDGSLCREDQVVVWRHGRFEIDRIKRDPVAGEDLEITDGRKARRADIASIHGDACVKLKDREVCAGAVLEDNLANPGLVLGVFPDKTVAFAAPRQPLRRLPAGVMRAKPIPETDAREVRDLARSLSRINEALNVAWPASCEEKIPDPVPLAAEPSCDAPDPAAPISGSKPYFEALLARGTAAPLADFLRLWYPERGDGVKVDSSLFNCEAGEMGALTGALQAGREEDCRPEVLYSWGPAIKAAEVKKALADDADWSDKPVNPPANYAGTPGLVYSTLSPVATFGYGERLLRFKLKRGARFVAGYTPEMETAVGVRTEDGFHDFTFRDGAVVASVSSGTPELYDEVVRDILRYQSGRRVFAYFAPKNNSTYDEYFFAKKEGPVSGIDRLYGQSVDGHKQSEEVLKLRLLELIREILAGEGEVHFAQGTCRSRAQHYSVTKKTHFIPD